MRLYLASKMLPKHYSNNSSGWELLGSEIISCQQDGTWKGDVPRCEHSECEPLANVTHGRIVKDSDITRRVECEPCYGPTNPGAEILQCVDGRWSPPKPTQCEGMYTVQGGRQISI